MGLVRITEPVLEPITLAEAKAHLRHTLDASDTTDDALIERLIAWARSEVERETRRSLLSQKWRLTLEEWPATRGWFEIPRPPFVAITAFTYYDADGVVQTLASSVYQVDSNCTLPRVALAPGQSWPSLQSGRLAPIVVEYTAGWTNAASVPAALRQAALVLLAHGYENREAVTMVPGAIPTQVALSFERACSGWWTGEA